MKAKRHRLLMGAVLAASTSLFFSPARAEEKIPMPTGTTGVTDPSKPQPWDPNPGPGTLTGKVLTYGKDPQGNTIPNKTLTIVNNSDKTVYPIMRNPNSKTTAEGSTEGLYDPYDPTDKEYRGYIGYKEGDTCYFGLKAGQSITVSLPLVFWNGARIGIGTDGTYLTTTDPNPLRYRPASIRAIAPAQSKDGVVMWYRATDTLAEAPNDDSEDQLAEWTIRDHEYMVKLKTKDQIPDTELVTLINYDVSNVDNLYLPLAMEVTDAWVLPQISGAMPDPNKNGRWTPGSQPEPNGWTGSIGNIESLQAKIREFTAEGDKTKPNKLLGQYFGGKGWPFYNIPNPSGDAKQPIKIPSGANIFAQSPLKATPGSYEKAGDWTTVKFMLSSGGTGAKFLALGNSATTSPKGNAVLSLNPQEGKAKMEFIQPGMIVTANPAPEKPKPNPIQEGTTVISKDPKAYTVTLSKPLANTSDMTTYVFTRPVNDYAADTMLRLWYSWAQYYLDHWKDKNPNAPTAPITVQGSMEVRSATISFTQPVPGLVPGMAVKGPGLDDAMTETGPHQGAAVILQVASDKKSAVLSQVARNPALNQKFTIEPPTYNPLIWTPKAGQPGYPLLKFNFAKEDEWRRPYEFSQAVYLIMASMNQIGHKNNDSQCKFMQDIIGANMGYIFDQPAKDSVDGQMAIAMIRDLIKSVLRGVSDFTKYPDVVDAKGKHLHWYPDPAEPTGGQTYNVFNLDPFVWFVHVELGFSGYGFSVDDDTADIGAGGANNLILTVAGEKGLVNKNVWAIQAPYGPVTADAKFSGDETDTLPSAIKFVKSGTPIHVTTDAPHHLAENEKVLIDQVIGVKEANGKFTIKNVSKNGFDLYDLETGTKPVTGTGTYSPSPTVGRWSNLPVVYVDTGKDLAKVFYRVQGDDALGTFLGTPVTAVVKDGRTIPVVAKNGDKLRIWRLGRQDVGRLLLNTDRVMKADGSGPLPADTYKFTFSAAEN